MKKILVMVCALSMVMALAGVASADGDWLVYFKPSNQAGNGASQATAKYGEVTGKTDGIDSFTDTSYASLAGTAAAIYCTNPLDTGNKMWQVDKRAPLANTAAGVKTWNLTLAVGASFPDAKALVKTWIGSAAAEVFTANAPAGYIETLKLFDADNNLVYDFTGKAGGSETSGFYSFLVDVTPGSSYNYTLVHQVVADTPPATTPEPGSIVALLSGIAGFGGLVIRRKK